MTPHPTWTYTHPFNWTSVPEWLRPYLRLDGPTVLFEPQSGAQEVLPGETIRMVNGNPEHNVPGAQS
jgi:hypothetical protein